MMDTNGGGTNRRTASDGGVRARRAIIRWALRLYRREWRQQILVLALLTVAVAATILGASAAYNTASASTDAEFGTANYFIRFEPPDADMLRTSVATAEESFGTIDVITHWFVRIPGSVERLEYRTQDPWGAFSAPMLALRDGHYPENAGEVAVTDGVADTFELDIGSVFALDGTERAVVGVVENPSDLGANFALVMPADGNSPELATILVRTNSDDINDFLDLGSGGNPSSNGDVRFSGVDVGSRGENAGVWAATTMLGSAAIAMVLVALVAAAAFVVVAQRRQRQLGMLAAIGATESHLRLVVVANGAIIGVVAAIAGAAAGMIGWVAVEPLMEGAVGHRIDPLNVPWWLIGAGVLLAIVTATGAAWWPARAVASVPAVHALSGRPPRAARGHHSAARAALFMAAGIVCLVVAGDIWTETRSNPNWTNALLLLVGTVATVIGVLLMSPLGIRALGRAGQWLPIAPRLALRDLARYQARSSMALAAISLAMGIASSIVISASAAEYSDDKGNLSNTHLLVRMGDPNDPDAPCPGPVQARSSGLFGSGSGPCPFVFDQTQAETQSQAAAVGQIAGLLAEPAVIALHVAVDPATEPEEEAQPAIALSRDFGDIGILDISLLYVATDEMLAHYGLVLAGVDENTEILTVETGELRLTGTVDPNEPAGKVTGIPRGYMSLPGTFITPDALRERGWETARVGWLVETNMALTDEQVEAARDLAAGAGLLTETRDKQQSLLALRSGATAAGMILALSILAMTVGLIRGEAGRDLRTLTATGATSSTRRALTGATAGALALLGVALGIAGAYLVLAAGYVSELDGLRNVPLLHLSVIGLGSPAAAACAGWILAGGEPTSLARQPIE
jgi:putative ABC transport system permease protein